ncbi:MAG: porin family protein [Deltaproteobacteria bacterium]|nr:MAG: porin family protein [Deltaproteobacteria bacterium]
MKKALLLTLAFSMLVPMTATSAFAHPAPHGHYHRYHPSGARVRYRRHYVPVYRPRRAPVVVVTPAPPPVLIVEEPPVRTVVRRPAEPARAVPRQRAPERRTLSGVGLRLSGATVDGEKVGLSTAENPAMGGIGVQFRTRFGDDQALGLELAADVINGSGNNFDQRTIPVMASLTYHLFPTSRLQPYGIAGVGVHFTRLAYLDGQYNIDLTELAGQLGAGVEFFLTKNIAINADIRAQTIFKNLDTQEKIRTDCLYQVGSMTGFCDNIHSADPNDKVNLGVQLQAGATWYF